MKNPILPIGLPVALVFGLLAGCAGQDKASHTGLPSGEVSRPTPVSVSTQACPFTPLQSPDGFWSNDPDFVIRSQADWTKRDPAEAPPPSVDFSKQMVLGLCQKFTCGQNCTGVPPAVFSVCTHPTYIEVDYQSGGCSCQDVTGQKGSIMMMAATKCMVAVPASDLPVSWVSP
jgi:hypothetical protein